MGSDCLTGTVSVLQHEKSNGIDSDNDHNNANIFNTTECTLKSS